MQTDVPTMTPYTTTDVQAISPKSFGSCWAPSQFLEDYGGGLDRMVDSAEFDFLLGLVRIELKAARANRHGIFVFQYIRPKSFDVCVCLAWRGGRHEYFVFTSSELAPSLSHQHRDSDSFQFRVSESSICGYASHRILPEFLSDAVKAAAKRCRVQAVRLDVALAGIDGWQAVAESIARRLKAWGFHSWRIFLRPLASPVDEDNPDLLPCPHFDTKTRQVEMWVHPEPLFERQNISLMARSLADWIFQYEFADDITKTTVPKSTGTNASGLRQLPIRTSQTTRVGQFLR